MGSAAKVDEPGPQLDPYVLPVTWIAENLMLMAEMLSEKTSPLDRMMEQMNFESQAAAERQALRLERKEQKRNEELARRQAQIAAHLAERERRDEEARRALAARPLPPTCPATEDAPPAVAASLSAPGKADEKPAPVRSPVPPVPITIKPPSLVFQDTAFSLNDLSGYTLRERAASGGFLTRRTICSACRIAGSNAWIISCAQPCASWVRSAGAHCCPMRSVWGRRLKPGWSSRSCLRGA